MDKIDLILEIKKYFGQINVEKHLFKNPECLAITIQLIDDLVEIVPIFALILEDNEDFSNLSEDLLEKILTRLIRFDNEINQFRKLN